MIDITLIFHPDAEEGGMGEWYVGMAMERLVVH